MSARESELGRAEPLTARGDEPAAIVVESLSKHFHRRGQPEIRAVDDVSFEVPAGSTLGLVGESGSGKSTLARLLLALMPADRGRVLVNGRNITDAAPSDLRRWRRDMQIVFQEPYESLDPRLRVGSAVAEPLLIHTTLRGDKLHTRIVELLELVQLGEAYYDSYPHELSGGEQQRVNIARALATDPSVVILDEPTSSLDVSVRSEILKLLMRLQRELQLTYVLISHDLATIRNVCDWVAVMYLGRIVEQGPARVVLAEPAHPYTEFLLGAELSLDPDNRLEEPVKGEARSDVHPPGCVFSPRCPFRRESCDDAQPPLLDVGRDHRAACILVRERGGGSRLSH